jgi:hypothetical protein
LRDSGLLNLVLEEEDSLTDVNYSSELPILQENDQVLSRQLEPSTTSTVPIFGEESNNIQLTKTISKPKKLVQEECKLFFNFFMIVAFFIW